MLALFGMTAGGILEWTEGSPAGIWAAYLVAYIFGGFFGTRSALAALRHGEVEIDMLMILAALGAASIGAPFEGAMLLFLFSFSNVLQGLALGRTRDAIKSLAKLRPSSALVERNGEELPVPIESVEAGEIFRLRPGDLVPLDGEVVSGQSSADQSSITGESIPVPLEPGDTVLAGSINQEGSLRVRVTRTAKDSTLARLIALVEEAQAQKASSQRFLESAEQRYAMGVILFTAALIVLLPTVFGLSWDLAFYRAITVMVVASPCALIISIPVSVLAGIANGARQGILFKGGVHLENAATIRSIAFDKTGTLTIGRPELTSVSAFPSSQRELGEADILRMMAALEALTSHPLAEAIVAAARDQGLELPQVENFHSYGGRGVTGTIDSREVYVGSPNWLRQLDQEARETGCDGSTNGEADDAVKSLQDQGFTVAILAQRCEQGCLHWLGAATLADSLRPEAARAVRKLRAIGLSRVVMLTGDSQRVAERVAREVGIDEVYAELLPEDKVKRIHELATEEPVAMVGDGVNDAPALAASSLGIAMGGAGSDIALESADLVLMSNQLERVSYAMHLSRATRSIILQNLVFAGGIIVVMVLATLFLPLVDLTVPLPLGVIAHEGGTVLVCLNGLRLLFFRERE